MTKHGYRVFDRIPAGLVVLRPSSLAKDAALVECHHDPAHLRKRGGSYSGTMCGVCGSTDLSRYSKMVAIVPEPNETQEALF